MLRRIMGTAVAGAALLAAFGCGGGGNAASVRTDSGRDRAVVPAADGPATAPSNAPGLRTVTYRGVQFDVPADWPVHDLDADPSTCVRFDQHAVYLGTPGPDMACPAGIIGRADAVLVAPTLDPSVAGAERDTGVSAATASGLELEVADARASSTLSAELPGAGVSVTLPYQGSDATAQQILQSFRAAS